jgi:hypothetical protein
MLYFFEYEITTRLKRLHINCMTIIASSVVTRFKYFLAFLSIIILVLNSAMPI